MEVVKERRMAHEIRNPLSSLDIHVQLLEEDLVEAAPQIKEKTAGRLEIIHGELHRLENIVKHFLSLAGPSSLDLQPVEVAKMLNHVSELLRPERPTLVSPESMRASACS
jgi:two-component system sensor histidine kinase HydH